MGSRESRRLPALKREMARSEVSEKMKKADGSQSGLSPKNPGVGKSMRANRSRNTGPEMLLRRMLRERGLTGYRLHWPVEGRPDVAFPGLKVAVFVHGCFWHRCPRCNPHEPQSNTVLAAEVREDRGARQGA